MVKYLIFFLALSVAGFSQKKDSIQPKAKSTQKKMDYEIKISRKQLLEASTIRDLIPQIPADCEIGECNFVFSAETGKLYTGQSANGNGIQKCLNTKLVHKAIYVDIKTPCKEYNSLKLVIDK